MNIPSNLMLDNREEYLSLIGAPAQQAAAFLNETLLPETCSRWRRHTLAYICIFGSNYVSVVDLSDARRLLDIPVGLGPLDIDINRVGLLGYVTNFSDHTLSMIDLRINRTVKTVPVGSYPAGVRLSRCGRYVYVVHYGEPSVWVLDAYSLDKVTEVPLPSTGFQIDITANGALAFVSLRSAAQIAVIDLSVNLVVKVIAAGAGTEDVRVSPMNRLVFVSNEDGNTITPVNIALAEPAEPALVTPDRPVGLAFSFGGSRMYCANRGDQSVSVFDVFTHREINKIIVGQGPYGAETANGGRLLVVTNTFEDTASIIDTRTDSVTSNVTVGFAPAFLAIL